MPRRSLDYKPIRFAMISCLGNGLRYDSWYRASLERYSELTGDRFSRQVFTNIIRELLAKGLISRDQRSRKVVWYHPSSKLEELFAQLGIVIALEKAIRQAKSMIPGLDFQAGNKLLSRLEVLCGLAQLAVKQRELADAPVGLDLIQELDSAKRFISKLRFQLAKSDSVEHAKIAAVLDDLIELPAQLDPDSVSKLLEKLLD